MTEVGATGALPPTGTGVRRYFLPPGRFVRRARGPYLYDQNGDRYLDAWLQDGAAFLGHRPQGYAQLAKAEIDRGLWGPFPTNWVGRLERHGRRLASFIAASTGTEIASLRIINGCHQSGRAVPGRWFPLGGIVEPSRPDPAVSDGVEVYRGTTGRRVYVVVPAPGVSVAGTSHIGELSSLTVALLAKGIATVVNALESPEAEERRRRSVDRPLPPGYNRAGVWALPANSAAGERAVAGVGADPGEQLRRWSMNVRQGWEKGIVLPPDPWTPIVLPPGISTYDETIWRRVCDDWSV